MTQQQRFDRGIVRGEAEITPEGYIKALAVVTRTGIFNYKNPDGSIRRELRHPDEVLNTDSLNSMKMIPVTNGHPVERLVDASNYRNLAVGYTGETIEVDKEYILSKFLVTDLETVKDIKERNRKELSLGYIVDLIKEDGTYNGQPYDYRQTNIRYNHLSIVSQARAGSEARIALDENDTVEIFKEENKMTKAKIKIDQEELMVEQSTAQHYEKLMKDYENLMAEKQRVEKELEMIKTMLEKAQAERDSAVEKKTQLDPEDKAGPVNTDSAEFKKAVRERVTLEKQVENVLGKDVKIDSLSDIDLKKKIILSRRPNMNLDSKSETYISVAYDIAISEIQMQPIVSGSKTAKLDHKEVCSKDARQKMIDRMINPKGAK